MSINGNILLGELALNTLSIGLLRDPPRRYNGGEGLNARFEQGEQGATW
jgi:hypothetical protein